MGKWGNQNSHLSAIFPRTTLPPIQNRPQADDARMRSHTGTSFRRERTHFPPYIVVFLFKAASCIDSHRFRGHFSTACFAFCSADGSQFSESRTVKGSFLIRGQSCCRSYGPPNRVCIFQSCTTCCYPYSPLVQFSEQYFLAYFLNSMPTAHHAVHIS